MSARKIKTGKTRSELASENLNLRVQLAKVVKQNAQLLALFAELQKAAQAEGEKGAAAGLVELPEVPEALAAAGA